MIRNQCYSRIDEYTLKLSIFYKWLQNMNTLFMQNIKLHIQSTFDKLYLCWDNEKMFLYTQT